MNFTTIILIAFALAMDAFAVSITYGTSIHDLKIKSAIKIAIFFGSFQAFMPILGYIAGVGMKDFISGIDHWIAFALLSIIGVKMIYESTKLESLEKENKSLDIHFLLILSIAVSIDAMAVGISFAFLKESILIPIIIIGIITFLLSILGVFIGKKLGHFFEKRIEIVGGLLLIGIGIKILIDHLG